MNSFWKKFIIYLLAAELAFHAILVGPINIAKATDEAYGDEEYDLTTDVGIARPLIDITNQTQIKPNPDNTNGVCDQCYQEREAQRFAKEKIYKFFGGFWSEGDPLKFTDLTGALSTGNNAKIILSQKDTNALRGLYCSSKAAPDFEQDFVNLYSYLSSNSKSAIPSSYLNYFYELKYGKEGETSAEKLSREQKFSLLIKEASDNFAENWRDNITKGLKDAELKLKNNISLEQVISQSTVDMDTLRCVTGMTENEILNYFLTNPSEIYRIASSAIDGLIIDIRILKMLVYLVTPKDEGGAGHWRIKVRRILQEAPLSSESETIYKELKAETTRNETNCQDKTAAECGWDSNGEVVPNLEITDTDGEQYSAFLSSITEDDRNISAHKTGQAIDIEQIDDIRCTMVKKRRLAKDSKSSQPPTPIKLAWQTTEGYQKSGGNPQDIAGMLKQSAVAEIQNFLLELGADTSGYESSLVNANIGDYGLIIGESILAQLLNSGNLKLSGANLESTLENLGGEVFADYIGLPKDTFYKEKIRSLDDLKYVVGRTAIEKRLELPAGSLDSYNFEKSGANGYPVNDLEGLFLNAGKRKLEIEMNLNRGDLDGFVSLGDDTASQNLAVYIGQRVVEDGLNLKKGSFVVKGQSGVYKYKDLKNFIGILKMSAMELNPSYMDNVFHIESGTTKKLTSGQMDAYQFAILVGQKRLDDTAYGFKYFSSTDSAYELTEGTWGEAMLGDKTSIINIGISLVGKIFSAEVNSEVYSKYFGNSNYVVTPKDPGKTAARNWFKDNLGKNGEELCKPQSTEPKTNINIVVADKSGGIVDGETVSVSLNESLAKTAGLSRSDIYRIFGCETSSGKAVFERVGGKLIFYGLVASTDPDRNGRTYDLLDSNSIRQITENNFYLSRKELIENNIDTVNSLIEDTANNHPAWSSAKKSLEAVKASFSLMISDAPFSLNSISAMAEQILGISYQFDLLKNDIETIRFSYENDRSDKLDQVNRIIIKINETIRAAEEIVSGHEIYHAETISIDQIDTSALSIDTNSSSGSNNKKVSPTLIFSFLAGQISFQEMVVMIASFRVESRLDLPNNSLIYYVQNAEKKGISNKESFYQAVGQAKIEETYGMDPFYFQGVSADDEMPLFNYDMGELAQWVKDEIFTDKEDFLYYNGYYASEESKTRPKYSEDLNIEFLSVLRANRDIRFDQYTEIAKRKWQENKNKEIKSLGGTSLKELTLEDVVKNIDNRQTKGISNSGGSYLTNKFGLSAPFSALVANAAGAWSSVSGKANEVDDELNIARGSTKSLFTGLMEQKSVLSEKEIQYLEAKLQLPKNAIELFIKLLNKELTLDQVSGSTLQPDYIHNNPYFQTPEDTGSCPLEYQLKNGFNVNEQTLKDDDYCYYDKEGRHCFSTYLEADKYKQANIDKAHKDIISLFSSAFGLSRNDLIDYISGRTEDVRPAGSIGEVFLSDQESGILSKLFVRDTLAAPVQYYKRLVGAKELEVIAGENLLSTFGISLSQYSMDGSDLFDILHGDLSSLSRIAMDKIDETIGLPYGSTSALTSIKSSDLQGCGLASIASGFLADALGLKKISLSGNIADNIGKQKITEAWGVPGSAFFGNLMEDVITRIGPIQFASKLNLPLSDGKGSIDEIDMISDSDLAAIFGSDKVNTLKDQSNAYLIEQVINQISYLPKVTDGTKVAVNNIESNILARFTNMMMATEIVDANTYTTSLGTKTPSRELDYEINKWNSNLVYLNSILKLPAHTTYNLFSGKEGMTPNSFVDAVSFETGGNATFESLAQVLGYTPADGSDAFNALTTAKEVFICNSNNPTRNCPNYHNWSKLYESLNQVFEFKLDEKLGIETGTFKKLLENYNSPGPILFEIGAKKLDENYGLDPSNTASFSEIYRRFGSQGDENSNNACLLAAYGANNGSDLTGSQLADANRAYNNCKESIRSSEGKALELAKDNAASIMGNNVRSKSGVNIPNYDIRRIFDGDLRYVQIAGISYAANYVYVSLDKASGRSCRSEENGRCEIELPQSMKVSYDDIKLAYFGNNTSNIAAENAAAWAMSNNLNSAANPDNGAYNIGDICPPGNNFADGAIKCLTSEGFIDNTESISRDGISLVDANISTVYSRYGIPDQGFTASGYLTSIDNRIAELNQENTDLESVIDQNGLDYDEKQDNIVENLTEIERLNAQKSETMTKMAEAKEQSKKQYQEALKYRMLDAAFWKIDANIFPGFSYALFKGSAKDKSLALATYTRNGLLKGELFGQKFYDGVSGQDAAALLSIYRFTRDWDMNKFVSDSDGGFDYLTNLIASKSEDWLGFEISNDMAAGLISGIYKGTKDGDWNFGFDKQNGPENTSTDTYGNRQIPTLANVVINWATSKIFAWADERLGLEPGTLQLSYTLTKNVYDAYKAYQAAKATNDAAQAAKSAQALASAVVALLDFIAQKAYENNYSDDVARLEEKWELAPGTLDMVVRSIISVIITYAVAQTVGGAVGAAAAAALPVAIAVAVVVIIVAVLINLFGVYKVDYYCTADGYYPFVDGGGIERTPWKPWAPYLKAAAASGNMVFLSAGAVLTSASGKWKSYDPNIPQWALNKNDISGLGIWDGKDASGNTKKTIEAAQYKANRLIGDLLNIQESPMFKGGDTVMTPVQIMTGRQEDVDDWNDSVTVNLCRKRLGDKSVAVSGVCGSCSVLGKCEGNTRMGLWANPQTIAWTHIGY